MRDDHDACPLEKGAPDPDPKQNGCPKAVRVTQGEIVILQQVQFDTAKATIKPVSNALLEEVALLLLKGLSHKEIAEVRGVAETTVRQQARALYKKAGLGGRNDLAAFFLEDLLGPQPGVPTSPGA